MRTATYRETYAELTRLHPFRSTWTWYLLLIAVMLLLPQLAPMFIVSYMTMILIASIGAIGLNLVTGTTGLISLGHAGFLAIGAYTMAILTTDHGWDAAPALLAAGGVAAFASLLVGIPSLRLRGLYLAITTLTFSMLVTHVILQAEWLTRGSRGMPVTRTEFFSVPLSRSDAVYYIALAAAALAVIGASNLLRSRVGRAWAAIRDYDTAASLMGISLVRYKLMSFGVSAFFTGVAGAVLALHVRYVNVDDFNLVLSVEAVAMIIVGGLGSVRGAVLGAALIVALPDLVRLLLAHLGGAAAEVSAARVHEVKALIYAVLIIAFLRLEPDGLAARWTRVKRYWTEWPLGKRQR